MMKQKNWNMLCPIRLIMKIDEYLDYPRLDIHGSIIPLSGTGDIKYTLSEVKENIPFKVIQIPMAGNEKKYCTDHNFLPGSEWHIKTVSPGNDSFLVTNGGHYFALSDHLADKIKVIVVRE